MTDPKKRRLVERLAEASYLEGLEQKPFDEVKAMRDEAREGERELSFERRLCQARIDILSAEIDRREGREDRELISRLPEILATEARGSDPGLPSRAPDFSVPRNADVPRRRVEEIVGEQTLARLGTLPVEELKEVLRTLKEHEQDVSARRRTVQDVTDRIQAEVVRRYQSGEEDPAAAFSG